MAIYIRKTLSLMIVSILILSIGTAYHNIHVRGSSTNDSIRPGDSFEESYAAYLYSRLLLNYYEVNGVANRLVSIKLYPPLEFQDYMKTVEDILGSLDILMDKGDYFDVIQLSTVGLEVLGEANKTLSKFMMSIKPIAESFYYYRQRFSRIYNNTLILLEIAEGIRYSGLDNLIPLNLNEVKNIYSTAREIRYNIYRFSIYDLESSAKYLERRIYRYYYVLGIQEGDISSDIEESDIIRRIKDLNSRLLDTYNLVLEERLSKSHPVFRKLDMLRKVLDDAETLLLSKGAIYYAQYIIIFCERQLTFVDRVVSNENVLLGAVEGNVDDVFIRFEAGGNRVLLIEKSIPRIYIYLDKDVETYRVTVSILALFRDLDGDGYMDEDEEVSVIYLDELNWTMWFNESHGLMSVNYVYRNPLVNITLSFRMLDEDTGAENMDTLEKSLVSLDVDVKHALGGEKGLRLGLGLLVTPGSGDLTGATSDYITIREGIFSVESSRWYFSIINGRMADIEGVYEPMNNYIEEPKCCRKSLLYMSIIDYESAGEIEFSYKYYVGETPGEKLDIIDIMPVLTLFGLIFFSVILLLYLYIKGLVDFSRLTRVPISR